MLLKVLTPSKALIEKDVTKVVAEGLEGSFGILPSHMDFVTAVVPSIVYFATENQEGYLAVDEGLLIKKGHEVTVCVREASDKRALGELERAMEERLMEELEESRSTQAELDKLQLRFIKQFYEFKKR